MCSCSICKQEKSSEAAEDSEAEFFFCKLCEKTFCFRCVTTLHLQQNSEHISAIYYLCDDCEAREATLLCKSCGQNLCINCDLRIHNKGKRAQHQREQSSLKLEIPTTIDIIQNNIINQEDSNNNSQIALLICSQNFFKELEKNFTVLLEHKTAKSLILLILDVIKDEKTSNFENNYKKSLETIKKKFDCSIQILIYSFEKHAKNKLKSFIKSNTLFSNAKNSINFAIFVTTGIKYLDLQILEEIFSEKTTLFSLKTQLFFLEFFPFTKDSLILQEISSFDHLKQIEARTFEEISKNFQPKEDEFLLQQISRSQNSIKNPNASFQFQLNTSASSFESSALFMASSQNPLNHSFTNNNTQSLNQSEILHSALNNSFDPGIPNKAEFKQKSVSIYIPYFQKMKEVELKGLIKLSLDVQRELYKLANEGELLIPKSKFFEVFLKLLSNSSFSAEMEILVHEAEQCGILHSTTRKFEGYPERQEFISLNLEHISLESLVWVLKSIRKDAMTPTEKIILSRIKECFKLKITPKQWEKVILSIKLQKFSQENDPYSTLNKPSLPIIVLSKIKDPLIGNETNVLKFKGQEWSVEDQGKIEEEKDVLWKTFISFLNGYFKNQSQKTKLEEIPEKIEKNSESEINYNDNSLTDQEHKARQLSISELKFLDENKAIPGGRYGCAQFIKTCAPEDLRKCSLGKLNLYVQEAINKGFIKYHRTLLVKDYSKDEENSYLEGSNNISGEGVNNLQREAKIKALQKSILEILKENPNGVSLAQIPQLLRVKALFPFNLQELGFPKLKNFLASMSDKIRVEMAGTNNSYAFLTENAEESNNFGIQTMKQFGFSANALDNAALLGTPLSKNLDKKSLKKKFNTLKFPITEKIPNTVKQQNRKKVSSLEEYLSKVINMIYSILIEHNYGLRSDKLYAELCKKLTVDFNFRMFGCPDFYTFLATYLESMIDIECKNFSLFIYPKDFRFGGMMPRKKENTEDLQNTKPNNPTPFNFENPSTTAKPKQNFNLNLNSVPFNYNEKFNKNGLFANNQPHLQSASYNKFNTINNMNFGGFNNMMNDEDFLHKKSLSIANYGPSLYNNANFMPYPMFNLSPNNNNNNLQGNSVLSPHTNRSPSHNRNISYWNINGPAFDPTSFLNNGSISIHSRNDSKNTITRKYNEESNLEIDENIKFIEDLLQEDQEHGLYNNLEKTTSGTTSLFKSGSFSTNNNITAHFNLISAIKPSPYDYPHNLNEKMHFKASSYDLNDLRRKKLEEKANNIIQHGRVQSNLEQNMIKDAADEEGEYE